MPRPKSPNKKPKEELIVRTPSEPFYKAFLFPKEGAETTVDISGDTFSPTMEDAVLAELYRLSWEDLCRIPFTELFIGEGSPEAVDLGDGVTDVTSEHFGNVVIMMLRAHYDAEYEAGKIDVDDAVEDPHGVKEFMFRMKALTEGYTMGVQDYRIQLLTMKKPNAESPAYTITECTLAIDDTKHKNAAFPDILHVVK